MAQDLGLIQDTGTNSQGGGRDLGAVGSSSSPGGQDQSQAPQQSQSDSIWSSLANGNNSTSPTLSQGAMGELAGNAVKTVAEPLIRTGGFLESGIDQTFGRVLNAASGNGFVPTATGQQAQATATQSEQNHTDTIAGHIGDFVGTIAPYLTGTGEAATAEKVAPIVAKVAETLGVKAEGLLPKVMSYLATKAPTIARDTTIGTAQTGDLGQGAVQGAFAGLPIQGAKAGSKLASNVVENTPKRELQGMTDALTPVLKPTQLSNAIGASAKKGEEFNASATQQVQRVVQAVHDAASALGQKATDIVKPGIQQAKSNGARIGQAIADYSKNVVTPFIAKSGVNYNFADLSKALGIVKPGETLTGPSLTSYNNVRQRILSAVATKVGPEVKGMISLSALRNGATEGGTVPAKALEGDKDFWDSRKIIDQIVNEETKGKAWGDATVVGAKAAYKDMRDGFAQYLSDAYRYPGQMENVNKANDFLSTPQVAKMDKTGINIGEVEKQFGLTPSAQSEANSAEWEHHMQTMSSLYDGIANTTTRAAKEEGKSWLSLFTSQHPLLVKGLEVGAGAIGAGALFKGGQNIANGL